MVISNHDSITIGSVLSKYCRLEWCKGGYSAELIERFGQPRFPARLLWRYSEPSSKLAGEVTEIIIQTVLAFNGNVNWQVEFSGRNWILAPKDFLSFWLKSDSLREVEVLEEFVKQYPGFSIKAENDVPVLLAEIDENLRKKVVILG